MNTLQGRIVEILKEESGVSKAGKDWQKQDFVIETDGKYPKKVYFTMFNDKLTNLVKVGSEVEVSFSIESREYNGRWFTNINAFSVNLVSSKHVDYNMTYKAKDIDYKKQITAANKHKEQYDKAVDVETMDETDDQLPF